MGSMCFRHVGDTSNSAYLDGHVGEWKATVELDNRGHDLATGESWGVTRVGKLYKCYYPFGVGATQTRGDDYCRGVWPAMTLR